MKLAEKEAEKRRSETVLTQDYAYRALGNALLERGTNRCLHLEPKFGPQTGFLMAWDKDLKLVCALCVEGQIDANATNTGADRNDFCDGCQKRARDVVSKTAAVDLHIFQAGLCGACRRTADFSALHL